MSLRAFTRAVPRTPVTVGFSNCSTVPARVIGLQTQSRWFSLFNNNAFFITNAQPQNISSHLIPKRSFAFERFTDNLVPKEPATLKVELPEDLPKSCAPVPSYFKNGKLAEAMEWLNNKRKEATKPPLEVYHYILQGVADDITKSLEVFEAIKADGLKPTQSTYALLTNAYIRAKQQDKVVETFNFMRENKMKIIEQHYNAVIDSFCRLLQLDKAMEQLEVKYKDGFEPNVDTYNTMLRPFVKAEKNKDIKKILTRKRDEGVMSDPTTRQIFKYFVNLIAVLPDWKPPPDWKPSHPAIEDEPKPDSGADQSKSTSK